MCIRDRAVTLERLGYGAIWIGGSPSGDLRLAEQLLDATTTLRVATGIVNIWKDAAEPVAASYHRIEARHPGRFLLGIGVGHPEAIGARYAKPYEALVGYLDELDAAQVPIGRRVLAALGPKMLKLSAERAAGAHPYVTTRARPGRFWVLRFSWPPSRRWSWIPTRSAPARSGARLSRSRTWVWPTTRATCARWVTPTPI